MPRTYSSQDFADRATIHDEAVAAGIALLDRARPGWRDRVDRETLHLSSCQRCVIGQLFGDDDHNSAFTEGLLALGLEPYGDDSADNGFDTDVFVEGNRDYDGLRAAWVRALWPDERLLELEEIIAGHAARFAGCGKLRAAYEARRLDDAEQELKMIRAKEAASVG